ncbi:MAG: zinc finger domain-containing protein [DPANN group archaeon]|nr:zinc finger domain-containing protein [DPANN group archaeon]
MTTKSCSSCKKAIDNDRSAVKFACPSCGTEIVRCGTCRQSAVKYKCSCGFEGP